jgi:hypothetical protein
MATNLRKLASLINRIAKTLALLFKQITSLVNLFATQTALNPSFKHFRG